VRGEIGKLFRERCLPHHSARSTSRIDPSVMVWHLIWRVECRDILTETSSPNQTGVGKPCRASPVGTSGVWPCRRAVVSGPAALAKRSEDADRGAVPEVSRWSSAAPPTGTRRRRVPASRRDARADAAPRIRTAPGDRHAPEVVPLARLRRAETVGGRRVRWCRCARPPANFREPSGFTARRRETLHDTPQNVAEIPASGEALAHRCIVSADFFPTVC
jgi:hypothetical protein